MDYAHIKADPFYEQACELVKSSGRASISMIQRKLRIGYNRAAWLIEAMETDGIVGPLKENFVREVLTPNMTLATPTHRTHL